MSVTLPCEIRSKFPKSEKTLQLSHKQRHLTLQFVSKDWDCSKSKCLNAQCTSIQRALVVVTVSCWWISTTPFTRLDRTSSSLIAPSNVDTGQCEQAMQNLKLECEQYNHDCIIRQSKNFQQHPVEKLQEDIDIGGKKTADSRPQTWNLSKDSETAVLEAKKNTTKKAIHAIAAQCRHPVSRCLHGSCFTVLQSFQGKLQKEEHERPVHAWLAACRPFCPAFIPHFYVHHTGYHCIV